MTKPTKLPGFPKPPSDSSPELRTFLTALSEAVEIRLGRRGDPRDRAITLRELVESGLAVDLKAAPFDPNNINNGNIGIAPDTVFNSALPPAPSGFAAAGAYNQINLFWTFPIYTGHAFTEIYRSTTDNLATANLIGVSSGRAYIDAVGSGASFYYWIRFVSTSSVPGPYNSGSGTLGETAVDVDFLLGVLAEAVGSSQLTTSLQTEISKISGDITVSGSVAAQVAAEATARATALSNEADARGTAISAEADARVLAINSSAANLQSQINDIAGVPEWDSSTSYAVGDQVRLSEKLYQAASANSDSEPTFGGDPVASTNSDWTLLGDYTSLASVVSGNSSAITQLNFIDSTSTSASAVAIKALQTGKEDTGVAAAAVQSLTTNVLPNYATTASITDLETAIFNDITGVADWLATTTYAEGDRVVQGKKLYRATAASTDEAPPNASYWELDTLAQSSAVSALTTSLSNYTTTSDLTTLLGAKEADGTAAGLLTSYTTTVDSNARYALSTALTNLESATFSNLAGLSVYDAATTYAEGDRVVFGTGAEKKIYIAVAGSDSTDPQQPTVPAYWNEDSLASAALVTQQLEGKETSGAAATALTNAQSYTDNNAASASEFSLVEAALFEDVAGVLAWDAQTTYLTGNRVFYERKIYVCLVQSANKRPDLWVLNTELGGTNPRWEVDSAASAKGLSELKTDVNNNYAKTTAVTTLLAGYTDTNGVTNAITNAIEATELTASQTYALATSVSSLTSSIFNDLINLSAWDISTTYAVGAKVKHDNKIWKAISGTLGHEPGSNANKWVKDSLLTAAEADGQYASTSSVDLVRSNLFNNMAGATDWNNSTNYVKDDRVIYTDANGVSNLYVAKRSNSNRIPADNLSGENPRWALDTIASALALSALTTEVTANTASASSLTSLVAGKENTGVAAGLIQTSEATAADTYATTVSADAQYAAIFDDMTGLSEWDATTNYVVGDKVVRQAPATNNAPAGPRQIFIALRPTLNRKPENNLTGTNPQWALETLSFAGAFDTLETTVNADGTGLVDRTSSVELRIDDVGGVSMEEKFTAQATATGDLESQYSVKIDNNGYVAGYGLSNSTAEAFGPKLITNYKFQGSTQPYHSVVVSGGTGEVTFGSGSLNILKTSDVEGEVRVAFKFPVSANKTYRARVGTRGGSTGTSGLYFRLGKNGNHSSTITGDTQHIFSQTLGNNNSILTYKYNFTPDYTGDCYLTLKQGYYANDGDVKKIDFVQVEELLPNISEFTVSADRFAVVNPDAGSAVRPFVIQTRAETIDGVSIPAGVYMDAAFIKNASITSAQIGEINADKITSGTIDVADRISANTIDASKLVIDNATMTSVNVNGVPTLKINALDADLITGGRLDFTNVEADNLFATRITGDINRIIPFSIADTVPIETWTSTQPTTTLWEGTIPASETPRVPYVMSSGWGNFEVDDSYKLQMFMKNNTPFSNQPIGSVLEYRQPAPRAGYSARFLVAGDVRNFVPSSTGNTGAVIKDGNSIVGYVWNAQMEGTNTLISINPLSNYNGSPFQTNWLSVGTTLKSSAQAQFYEVQKAFFRPGHDYHAHMFSLQGGFGNATTSSIEVRIEISRYAPAGENVPHAIRALNSAGGPNASGNDSVYEFNGVLMSLR